MADAARTLCDQHTLQVEAFLRFAKKKREESVREVGLSFDDMNLDDAVYTKDDVSDMMDGLRKELTQLMEKEITFNTHSSALLLRQLLAQAESADLAFEVDVRQLENEQLLKSVAGAEKSAAAKPASMFARKATQLGKLEKPPSTDPKMMVEMDRLRGEVERLRAQLSRAEAASTAAKQQASEFQVLSAEVERERKEQAALALAASANQGEMERALRQAQATNDKLTQQLREANKSLEARDSAAGERVSESKQFMQMKKLMQQKSLEVQRLRKHLQKYEPSDLDAGDADA